MRRTTAAPARVVPPPPNSLPSALISVSALAGYCQTTAGARVAFAFLMNGVNVYAAHTLQDRMASVLARYSP